MLLKPYLIQRLQKPTGSRQLNDAALGFSKQGLDSIKQLMDFDYMGNSEFEGGALPKAFGNFIEHVKKGSLEARTISIEFLPPGLVFSYIREKLPPTKTADIHIIAPAAIMQKVVQFLQLAALEEPRLAERSHFAEAVYAEDVLKHNAHASGKNTVGWFDLKNSFFFFRDKEMFEDIKFMSGLDATPAPAPAPAPLPARKPSAP